MLVVELHDAGAGRVEIHGAPIHDFAGLDDESRVLGQRRVRGVEEAPAAEDGGGLGNDRVYPHSGKGEREEQGDRPESEAHGEGRVGKETRAVPASYERIAPTVNVSQPGRPARRQSA